MNKRFFLSIFFTIITTLNGNPPIRDLESSYSPFVLETKRLIIPEHPTAFNPSIIRWRDSLIMCFRVYSPHSKTVTAVGVVKLDEDFNPIGKTQILNIHYGGEFPSREQDPRLIEVGDHLYMVYSNFDRKNDWVNWIESVTPNSSEQPDSTFVNIVRDVLNVDRTTQPKEARRVFVAELKHDGEHFSVAEPECIKEYEGRNEKKWEKNWVPFEHNGELHLSYSISPHLVFRLKRGESRCETAALTKGKFPWNWGVLRGGTPALMLDGEYLSFFHTCKDMITVQSCGDRMVHYFMGACTYSGEWPFKLTKVSKEPIFGLNFYNGPTYKTWKPLRVVFPGGFIFNEEFLWVFYGRQDHEIWVVKIDRKKLIDSLIPVVHEH